MDSTLFLSQVLGLYLTIMAVAMLIRPGEFKAAIGDATKGHGMRIMGGSVALIIGILLVLVHNVWVAGPAVVITILAWYILIKGVLLLAFPDVFNDVIGKLTKEHHFTSVFTLAVGIYLLYHGFMV